MCTNNETYFLNCFEVSPSFLKGQIKTFNPFERSFKHFLFGETIIGMGYNKENYDKMVEDYYIYKNQYKKYGLTFNVNEECGENGEEYTYLDKIFFLPENYREEYEINEGKILYEGKDYYLIYTYHIEDTYEEEDNKAYFELDFYDNPKKFDLEIITLNKQYQQNIKPEHKDLIYIDTKKLGKSFKSLYTELTEKEIINYRRIMEIPFIFNFIKSARNDSESKLDSNYYYEKILNNAPLISFDKYDFIKMLNVMYEDQYLSHFKQKGNYYEREDYEMDNDKYMDEFGDNGDLDVKDVKDIEEYLSSENSIYNVDKESLVDDRRLLNRGDKISFDDYINENSNRKKTHLNPKIKYVNKNCNRFTSFKENLMSKEYPFIKTKKVVYEICERSNGDFYRRYIIYDPVNSFCSFYSYNDIFDNDIYGLKKDQRRMFK